MHRNKNPNPVIEQISEVDLSVAGRKDPTRRGYLCSDGGSSVTTGTLDSCSCYRADLTGDGVDAANPVGHRV